MAGHTNVSISMPHGLLERLDAHVPKRQRSDFVRTCVEMALDRFDEHEKETGERVVWPDNGGPGSGAGPADPDPTNGAANVPPVATGPAPDTP